MGHCEVLIIDGDSDDMNVLADCLTGAGVNRFHCVVSAAEAFNYLDGSAETDLPKLIVVEPHLPGLKGIAFLNTFKEKERYKHIPIVVLSGFAAPETIERYRQAGIADFIKKPASYEGYIDVAKEIKGILAKQK